MQSKNWKQWIDEFLEGKGDFGDKLAVSSTGDLIPRRK